MLHILTNSTLSHLQILFMLFLCHYTLFSRQLPLLKFHPSSSTLSKTFQKNSANPWKIFFSHCPYITSPKLSCLPRCLSGKKKKSTCQYRRFRRHGFNSWIRKTLWRRKWQPTPVLLPGVSHGQRRLVGYSP